MKHERAVWQGLPKEVKGINLTKNTPQPQNSFYLLTKPSQQAERNVNIFLSFYIILMRRRTIPHKSPKTITNKIICFQNFHMNLDKLKIYDIIQIKTKGDYDTNIS